jgi:uncharacterized protein (DUF1015 family)
MPRVHPFSFVGYPVTGPSPTDLSRLLAPPYDVLSASDKARLLDGNPHNIVAIDLPHLPAKSLGPSEVYEHAGALLGEWLHSGVLVKRDSPAMIVYRIRSDVDGVQRARLGLVCTIDLLPLGPRPEGSGGGVLPHEETFLGPKKDRLALMHSTGAQLSPIFGLVADTSNGLADESSKLASARQPDAVARLSDSTDHEAWVIDDPVDIARLQSLAGGQDVVIADGHHRYNTALSYLQDLESSGATPGPEHPARRCLFVLVSMNDPGVTILPTHRVLGGMSDYTFESFAKAASGSLQIHEYDGPLETIESEIARISATRAGSGCWPNAMGLYDYASGRCAVATLVNDDPLLELHGYKPLVWRRLDVAIVQHLIVEGICQPALNQDCGVTWQFPHTLADVLALGLAKPTPQLAIILRPTPLSAVREVCALGELMPQKSTFFSPKLATGLAIHLLDA